MAIVQPYQPAVFDSERKTEVFRLYETTILDHERQYSAKLLVMPKRALSEGNQSLLEDPFKLMETLGLALLRPLSSPSFLPHAIIAALMYEEDPFGASQM